MYRALYSAPQGQKDQSDMKSSQTESNQTEKLEQDIRNR